MGEGGFDKSFARLQGVSRKVERHEHNGGVAAGMHGGEECLITLKTILT
jgi:hypothetical protein